MTGNIVGEEFLEYVNKQIQNRQKIHGSGLNGNLRTPDEINYLSNRNAWIKMASSVQVDDNKRITNIKIPESDSESFKGLNLAKKSILFNTLVELKEDNKSYNTRSGISQTDSLWNNSAYGFGGTQFGLQPPPGILSINIDTINRGSIRKATVTLKAYNKFQFELIELLYLRLGFTMMLEWGWDKFINNDYKIEPTGNTLIEDYWFTHNNISQLDVLKEIERTREKYCGNYDGFFGKVSNYNWKFQSDGSYDISIDLITLGDVVESLQTRISATGNFLPSGSKDSVSSSMGQTTIDQWLYNKTTDSNNFKPKSDYIIISKEGKTQTTVTATETYDVGASNNIDIVPQKYKYYVTFGELINQLDQLCIPQIINGSSSAPQLYFDKDIKNILVKLFPNQIPINPRVCLFNSYLSKKDFKNVYSEIKNLKQYTIPYNKIMYGQLMNLYINFDFIVQTLKTNVDKRNRLSLYRFLENICDGINSAMGGVNKIQPIIKDDNIITFIDQSLQSSKSINGYKADIAKIEVYGYNLADKTSNFIKNINFETRLTKDTAAMISIGATATGNDTSIKNGDATAFSKWSEGLVDRFCQKIIDPSEIASEEVIQNVKIIANTFTTRYIQSTYSNIAQEEYKLSPLNYVELNKLPWDQITLLSREYVDNPPNLLLSLNTLQNTARRIAEIESQIRNQTRISSHDTISQFATDPSTGYIKYLVDAFGGDSTQNVNDNGGINSYSKFINDAKYYLFDQQFIDKGKALYTSYISSKSLINYNKTKNQSSQIGFLPLEFSITAEGISGMKIYNKLNISQDFLPSNYPTSFDFLVIKLNHKVDTSGWETEIGTLSTSNIDEQLDESGSSLDVKQEIKQEQVPVSGTSRLVAAYCKDVLKLTKEQTAGLMGNIERESGFIVKRFNLRQAYGLVQFDINGDFGGSNHSIDNVVKQVGSTVGSQLSALSRINQYKKWASETKSFSDVSFVAKKFALIYEYHYAKDEMDVAKKINDANGKKETIQASLVKAGFNKRIQYAITYYQQFNSGQKLDWNKLSWSVELKNDK